MRLGCVCVCVHAHTTCTHINGRQVATKGRSSGVVVARRSWCDVRGGRVEVCVCVRWCRRCEKNNFVLLLAAYLRTRARPILLLFRTAFLHSPVLYSSVPFAVRRGGRTKRKKNRLSFRTGYLRISKLLLLLLLPSLRLPSSPVPFYIYEYFQNYYYNTITRIYTSI